MRDCAWDRCEDGSEVDKSPASLRKESAQQISNFLY